MSTITELQNLINYFPWINLTDNLKDLKWKNDFIDKINKLLNNLYLENRFEYFPDTISLKTKQYTPIKTFINYGYIQPDQHKLKKYLLLNKHQYNENGILSLCLEMQNIFKEFNTFALEHFFISLDKNNFQIHYNNNPLFTEENIYSGKLSFKNIKHVLKKIAKNKPFILLIPISLKNEAIAKLINYDLDLTLVFLEELDLISKSSCYFYKLDSGSIELTIKHYDFLIDIDTYLNKDLIFDLNFEYMINQAFYPNTIYKFNIEN